MTIFRTETFLLTLALLGSAVTARAEPWIDTSNLALRAEIQYLADRGLIKAPVTAWPLMWASIETDLRAVDAGRLDATALNAWQDVMRHLDFSKRSIGSASITVANDDNRFAGFGDEYRDKNTVAMSYSTMGDRWALKLKPAYVPDPDDNEEFRLDESYLAGVLGNWVVSAGLQDRWWSPGWDTNLSLTSNARPMPAVALTRRDSSPFRLPFTDDYQIPWTVTTFMADMGTNRTIDNTLLWGFRLNFKAHPRLEVGVTRLAQWAGEGRPDGLGTFWDVLLGRDNCGNAGLDCGADGSDEPGNQQAGYDLRLSLPVAGHEFGLYYQSFAEDGSDSSTKFWTKARPSGGINTTVNLLGTPVLMFVEYTDSLAYCGSNRSIGIGNCYYEHHIYRTGMRYEGRAIGNLYDNDATSVVFGMISQTHDDTTWQWSLRYVELNKDNSDAWPGEPNGNSVTEVSEDLLMLSGKYQRIFGRWKIGVGGSASHSGFRDLPDDDDYTAFLDLEYLL
ncbi:MAG: capsule assembly Wzi family protein [Gammaproteobacteria bacterium]